ncbi:Arsenite methyltransferase [Tupaia chinensis]|uniref:Arsenite methyltransferase n=1 Tax=Tupaia chinensis TaxID=246437 RepID=L8YBB6_TUPCH|nr:Arsenite methyltransferase [Tupaia chinensis]
MMATGTPDSQARFGQSVKGLLTEKVNTCGTDVIALTKQVLKGSRSSEVSGQWALVAQYCGNSPPSIAVQEAIQKKSPEVHQLPLGFSNLLALPAMASSCDAEIHKDVQLYYGQELKKSTDLRTNACTTTARPVSRHVQEALKNVHEEVALRYYGCGLVIPECLESCWILDLGSGSGRDCYALSQLVGEKGHVTGIDMTEGQVEVAKKYLDFHMEKYGFQAANVTFIHGYIEKLGEAGIKNETYDIVISNCVINLVPDKQEVLREAYRVLKHGGELYFSDVYASLELPEEIRTHKLLWGDCCFVSATFRLFKLSKAAPTKRCQVIYNGRITGHEQELIFDANFTFKEGEVVEVDEETAAILKHSRFAQAFVIRPREEKCPTSGGCSSVESKDMITDPFKLAEGSGDLNSRRPPGVAGGCCGTKKSC